MYFIESTMWQVFNISKADRETLGKKAANQLKRNKRYESDDEEEVAEAKLSASNTPKSRGPVYHFDEHVLEMRSGMWEDKRGLISILSLTAIISAVIVFEMATRAALDSIKLAHQSQPYASYVAYSIFHYLMGLCVSWFYLKYGLRFTRLEMFTSRHLLIRFNRTTQQVHLHRPRYCGGIVTLPWHGVSSTGSSKQGDACGIPLGLIWSSRYTGTLHAEMAWVGKSSNHYADHQNEWEFIRRFMDEGPEGLPRPRLTSHFPWPWQGFTPQFEGLAPYFRASSWPVRLGLLMISPAFLIIGTGHWLSLLLCWKPRWPKIIREAGLPGKPVPPLTTVADYPEHIQQRLHENADLWTLRPGKRPEKKPRASNVPPKVL